MLKLTYLAIAAVLTFAGVRSADAKDNVSYPNASTPGISAAVTLYAGVYRPKGEGPFPAVIVLHGCGGHDYNHQAWAERFLSWGYVAVVVDSFGSRGHGSLCKRTDLVTPADRITDIIGTAEYLAKQPYVDKDRIGLIGFSHGGWTIMKAIQENQYLSSYGVKAAVAFYPYCNPKTDTKIAIPLLVLMGADDTWTPADLCRQLQASEALKTAAPTDMVFYPNTYHSFDRPERVVEVEGWSVGGGLKKHRTGGNPVSAEDAIKRTREFFDKRLKN